MVHISRLAFEELVLKALKDLPASVRERLENVDVVVRDWPNRAELEENGLTDPHQLFGLYEGVPLTDRTLYDVLLPDKITLFRHPIEAACDTRADVVREVRATVVHEVAHYLGLGEAELERTDYR